jgi:hypothetical protein
LLRSVAVGSHARALHLLRRHLARGHLTRTGATLRHARGVHTTGWRLRTGLRTTGTHLWADRRAAHVALWRALTRGAITRLDWVLGETCAGNNTLLRTVHTNAESL